MRKILILLLLLIMSSCSKADDTNIRIAKARAIVLQKKFYPYLNKKQLICVVKASVRHKVPNYILATILHKESSGGRNINPRYEAHLNTSSVGMFQVLKTTGKWMGYDPNTLHEVCNNADAAAKYLRMNYNKYKTWDMAVKRYNGRGPMARKYLRDAQRFSKKTFNKSI